MATTITAPATTNFIFFLFISPILLRRWLSQERTRDSYRRRSKPEPVSTLLTTFSPGLRQSAYSPLYTTSSGAPDSSPFITKFTTEPSWTTLPEAKNPPTRTLVLELEALTSPTD